MYENINVIPFEGAKSKNPFSFRLPEDEENALADICEKYLLAQLDCGFKTLSFYHEVKN